ncbi:MAG: hypothetical protein A2Y39_07365 [Candidatus Delongbacteria bacterium GWF2_40_14]|nr:MAG: hypothetical protein A2Y39_07365 [Candidatus Delongbacteria bacterium GWF2_40_14]
MELQIIRHKNASDYLRDFFPPDTAEAYSYQLQRMFESGAAKEGDYFLVTDSGKSYLQAEIYRNNTRRIWEKTPVISPKAVSDSKKTAEAVGLIYDFLSSDEFYFSASDRLEIVFHEDTVFSEVMKTFAKRYGYEKVGEYIELGLKISGGINTEIPDGISFAPFTALEPEERFRTVFEHNELSRYFENTDPALFYQDYLDDGYFSEELWEMMYLKNELSGFIMPAFTSGLKDKIRLLNYNIHESLQNNSIAVVNRVIKICADMKVTKAEFVVNAQHEVMIRELFNKGAVKVSSFSRYIKK